MSNYQYQSGLALRIRAGIGVASIFVFLLSIASIFFAIRDKNWAAGAWSVLVAAVSFFIARWGNKFKVKAQADLERTVDEEAVKEEARS